MKTRYLTRLSFFQGPENMIQNEINLTSEKKRNKLGHWIWCVTAQMIFLRIWPDELECFFRVKNIYNISDLPIWWYGLLNINNSRVIFIWLTVVEVQTKVTHPAKRCFKNGLNMNLFTPNIYKRSKFCIFVLYKYLENNIAYQA